MESTTKMNKIVEEQEQEEEDQKEKADDEIKQEEGEDGKNEVEEERKQEDQKEEAGNETNPEQEDKLEEDRFKLLESNLVVKLPSDKEAKPAGQPERDDDHRGEEEEEEEEDGFKTPTDEEHKIPPMLECPSAPKRPGTWIRVRLARIVR